MTISWSGIPFAFSRCVWCLTLWRLARNSSLLPISKPLAIAICCFHSAITRSTRLLAMLRESVSSDCLNRTLPKCFLSAFGISRTAYQPCRCFNKNFGIVDLNVITTYVYHLRMEYNSYINNKISDYRSIGVVSLSLRQFPFMTYFTIQIREFTFVFEWPTTHADHTHISDITNAIESL